MDTISIPGPETVASLLARVLLGILFFMQGYDKIFKVKLVNVIDTIRPEYQKLKLPGFIIVLTAYFTSYVEFVCGFLLIIGMLKYYSLYLLGLDLIIVSFGMSAINPVWNMDLVFPRFLLLLFLLIYPAEYDIYTLQNLFSHLK